MTARHPLRAQALRGAAAVEFALVLPVFVLILYGLVTFGAAFYTQLAVSRAAEDGARAVNFLPEPAANQSQDYEPIKDEVLNALAASVITPRSAGSSFATRRAWLQDAVRSGVTIQVDAACNGAAAAQRVSVRIRYPYSDAAGTRILPAIGLPSLGGFEPWMPDVISACATAGLF